MAVDLPNYQHTVDPERNNSASYVGNVTVGLLETSEGDWVIGSDNDLLLANITESTVQHANFIVKTELGEASLYEFLGSELRQFIGRVYQEEILDEVHESLAYSLREANVRYEEDSLEVLPIKSSTILISFTILVQGSELVRIAKTLDVMSGAIEDIGGAQV